MDIAPAPKLMYLQVPEDSEPQLGDIIIFRGEVWQVRVNEFLEGPLYVARSIKSEGYDIDLNYVMSSMTLDPVTILKLSSAQKSCIQKLLF